MSKKRKRGKRKISKRQEINHDVDDFRELQHAKHARPGNHATTGVLTILISVVLAWFFPIYGGQILGTAIIILAISGKLNN